jgi:hypothetical protein
LGLTARLIISSSDTAGSSLRGSPSAECWYCTSTITARHMPISRAHVAAAESRLSDTLVLIALGSPEGARTAGAVGAVWRPWP